MRILQLDVNTITYKMIKPEASIYESIEKKEQSVSNALVIFITIEQDDTKDYAQKMIHDVSKFLIQQKIKNLVLYPFAHLSDNLGDLDAASSLFGKIKEYAHEKIKDVTIYAAPFGWNKQLSLDIKGYPLAEQSRRYGVNVEGAAIKKERKRVDLAIVKKSEWADLAETDHRKIGERQDLFSFQEISPGMVYWHNNGLIIYQTLISFITQILRKNNYQIISTPSISNIALWHMSGHMEHYKENMYLLGDQQDMGLKPMNCPSTIMIYKSRRYSYKDLPLRLAIFDRIYRNEISGALTGLMRLREFTQDDAHIFTSPEHLESELSALLNIAKYLYNVFGMEYYANLSTMPDVHLGDKETWDVAISYLKKALDANKIKYTIKEKDGAFYGPKIDIHVKDSLKREWQCGTIQVDYQLPSRFNISYMGEDGKEHMPILIHRALYGSLERFIGVMIEHYKGKFPTWISPTQVCVISISEVSNSYTQQVYQKIIEHNIRAKLDISDKTLEYKIRDSKMLEIPYTIIIGQKEEDKKSISIRDRNNKQVFGATIESFLHAITNEIKSNEINLNVLEHVEKTPN